MPRDLPSYAVIATKIPSPPSSLPSFVCVCICVCSIFYVPRPLVRGEPARVTVCRVIECAYMIVRRRGGI